MSEKPPTVEETSKQPAPESDVVAELESSRRQVEELLAKLKYLQAEFENFRKRAERDAEAVVRFAHEGLLDRLLPVLDEFDVALENLGGEPGEGIRMIRDNLVGILREFGLQEIQAVGTTFDPYVHDCVERVPDAGRADGAVKEVVRKGYRLRERILRPAQVIVVKNEGESNG